MNRIHKRWLFAWLMLLCEVFLAGSGVGAAHAQTPAPAASLTIYLFWGDGCPHCARAKPYLETLPAKYPGVVLKSYEIYFIEENARLFFSMAEIYGLQQLAVPTIFIGSYNLQGYSDELQPEIEAVVEYCLQNGCPDAGEGVIAAPVVEVASTSPLPPSPEAAQAPSVTPTPADAGSTPTPTAAPTLALTETPSWSPTLAPSVTPLLQPSTPPPRIGQAHRLAVPFLGNVDLDNQSIVLSTALIAVVDGFNPCSLWVLSMLLALTLHTGSRRKVLLIGFIFLSVTALIYALFITGLFSVLKLVSFMGWVQALVALIALFFGLVNVKDYFWYKEGLSFTIADKDKPGIYRRMRAVMDAGQSFGGLVGASAALAVGVSLVEFSCTAGFPVLWTNLLTARQVGVSSFLLLLVLYMLIYQADELVIFLSAVISLRASRLEEKHGRALKLVGGMLMLTLAVVMLVNPALMNDFINSLMIFGLALLATMLVLVLHRLVFPRLGIVIGNQDPGVIKKGSRE